MLAKLTQPLEQDLIASNLTDAVRLRLGRRNGLGELDGFAFFEDRQPFRRQLKHIEFVRSLLHQPQADQLAANGFPFGPAVFVADAVSGDVLVVPFADIFGVGASENFGDLVDPEVKTALLADTINAGEKLLRREGPIVSLARRNAVVARPAIFLGILLAEILQQLAPAAGAVFRIVDHLSQLRARNFPLFRVRFFIDEPPLLYHVARREQQHTIARQAITSSAPRLLVISLDIFRQIIMEHEPDIGLIDAHAEGDGCANHAHFVAQEKLLVPGPLGTR